MTIFHDPDDLPCLKGYISLSGGLQHGKRVHKSQFTDGVLVISRGKYTISTIINTLAAWSIR